MPSIEANGLAFHVQDLGAGPPVVMLHGLFVGSLASWYFTAAPALAERHRVRLYDLRGHGRSARARDGYDLPTMAEDLAALIPEKPVTLVGHSYGALVALHYALARPDAVARLALVEAPLPPSRATEVSELLGTSPEEMLAALPDDARALVRHGGRQARRLLGTLAFLAGETTLLADLAAATDVPDAELARLTCPVLCVYGSRSSCRGVGERLARVIPGAELRILEGGHYLHLDAKDALTEALLEFVDAGLAGTERGDG